jgi:DNA-binding IclR family transcriptional regulator
VRVSRPSDRRSLSRSATRALDVLECFGKERRWLKAIEIARMLALQGSSANQLLKTMVDSAHLVFDARHKTYFPSPRLVGFTTLISEEFGTDDRLRLLVDDLYARTGLSVTLTTPNDLSMQILYIEMPAAQRTERGLRIDIFGSAIGSAYLASLSNREIRALVLRAGHAPDAIAGILQEAFKVRQDGYADGSGPDPEIWTIAFSLPPVSAPFPLVLGVAGDVQETKMRRDELRKIMRAAVNQRLDRG